MANSTHYAALGLGNHERTAVISSAYRDLSWRYHPGRVGPGGESNFRPIADAYRVLSDSSLRRSYDDARARRDDAEAPIEPEPLVSRNRPSTLGAARSARVEVLSLRRESILASPAGEAMLARIARNFSGVGVPKSESTDCLRVRFVVAPWGREEDRTIGLGLPVLVPCETCAGHGGTALVQCGACDGNGLVATERAIAVTFAAGSGDGPSCEMSLAPLGIYNLYLHAVAQIEPALN